MGRGRADVRDHHDISAERGNSARNLGIGQVLTGGINQLYLVASSQDRTTYHEQSQRHLVPHPKIADSGAQWAVDQSDAHGSPPQDRIAPLASMRRLLVSAASRHPVYTAYSLGGYPIFCAVSAPRTTAYPLRTLVESCV